jgi:hypothetical protein
LSDRLPRWDYMGYTMSNTVTSRSALYLRAVWVTMKHRLQVYRGLLPTKRRGSLSQLSFQRASLDRDRMLDSRISNTVQAFSPRETSSNCAALWDDVTECEDRCCNGSIVVHSSRRRNATAANLCGVQRGGKGGGRTSFECTLG